MTTIDSLQQVLWDVEFVLRRQLQMANTNDDGSDPAIDPYTTQTTNPINEGGGGGESSQSRGRTVLTILYLCVLGLCFVVPVFYYFRLHCFEENARRELELDFTTALEQSEQHREESRAARRKYIEERRARIVQLLHPVRMILKEENFPHLTDPNAPKRTGSFLNLDFESEKYGATIRSDNESATMASEDVFSPYTSDDDDDDHDNDNNEDANDLEVGQIVPNVETSKDYGNSDDSDNDDDDDDDTTKKKKKKKKTKKNPQRGGVIETKCESENEADDDDDETSTGGSGGFDEGRTSKKKDPTHNPYGDEDTFFICIPVPGLPLGGSCLLDPTRPQRIENNGDREMRLTPGLCTICLSNYKVGSDIVWSSNEACDHHFHASCIEKWLMKQREGPLCPCCRRDFIVDPLDLLEEEENNINNNNNGDDENNNYNNTSNNNARNNNNEAPPPMFSWNPATLDDDPVFGPIIVTAPGGGAGNFAFSIGDPTRLEEGLNPPVTEEAAEPTEEEEEEDDAASFNESPQEDSNSNATATETAAGHTATGGTSSNTSRATIDDPGSAVQV